MRRQPVAFCLIDTAFLADSKWRALRRRLPEPRDYNAAVGAWLIILTAARRNGLPDIDAAEEAEDTTFLPDLIAVGLLTETGVPEKAFRSWAPSRPKYPGERVTNGTNGTNGTNVTSSTEPTREHASTPLPSFLLTSKNENARADNETDPWADPEHDATTWLAKHGCALPPNSGYYRQLVTMVEVHGVNAVVGMFDRLASAGTKQGDVKGYVFGAKDALDSRTRPNLGDVAKADRAAESDDAHQRRLDATQRQLAELRGTA